MDDNKAREVRRYIGTRIKHARALTRYSQQDLAAALTDYTGETWSREMVANLETGRKAIAVEVMCAIAAVQGQAVGWYFAEPPANLRSSIPG